MKKLLSIALVLSLLSALLLPMTACSSKSDKEFRVGMECAYAPFNWTQTDDSNGAVPIDGGSGYANGYDVQVAKAVAKALGRELVVVKVDWEGLPPALSSGKINAIIAGMSPTAERRESMDFSDYYYDSDLVVVVKKDSSLVNAKSISDFAGAKITAQLGTFHYDVLDQMQGANKQTAMEDFPTMIVALTSGKIDGYISERPGAMAAVTSNPDLTFVAFEDGKGFNYTKDDVAVSVALPKGSDLVDDVNKALAAISADQRQTLMQDAIKNQPLEG